MLEPEWASCRPVEVLACAGAALLPKLFVADDIAAGRHAYWGTHAGPPMEIWALRSSRRLLSTKVDAFLGVVEKHFQRRFSTRQSERQIGRCENYAANSE